MAIAYLRLHQTGIAALAINVADRDVVIRCDSRPYHFGGVSKKPDISQHDLDNGDQSKPPLEGAFMGFMVQE